MINGNTSRVPVVGAEIDAARMLLEKLGVTPDDLLRAPADLPGIPTFADYIPHVSVRGQYLERSGYTAPTGTAWSRRGDRNHHRRERIDIAQLAEQVKAAVVKRRNARGGRGAAEHLIAALRCLYKHAVADGILTESQNPAARVPEPHRLRSTRRALRMADLRRSSGWPRPRGMTRPWTPSCSACTPRPPAAAAAPWRWRPQDLDARAVPEPAARKRRDQSAGSRSRPPS